MYAYKKSSDHSLVILDNTNMYKAEIRQLLVDYKKRWNESIADKIAVTSTIDKVKPGATVIIPEYLYSQIKHKSLYDVIVIPSINLLTIYDLRAAVIDITVNYTKDYDEACEWLANLPDTFTYDSETTGLEHPSREEITMYSFGLNETEAFVIINENLEMQEMVMDFLSTTNKTMIIHNAQFDQKWIKYLTGKHPKNVEDSQLLAWAYLNHANTYQARTGLKHLAKKVYKDWAVAPDMFGIEHKYNPELIRYSGIDACATWFVYNEFTALVNKQEEELNEQIAKASN